MNRTHSGDFESSDPISECATLRRTGLPESSAAQYAALLDSASRLSFDLRQRADHDDSDDDSWGMTPEWSPLFGTPVWELLSDTKKREITRHEVAHFLGVAIWLEVALQVVLLRRNHNADPTRPDVKFLLNECADENLHSLMFVDVMEKLGVSYLPPNRSLAFLGWLFRTFAWDEVAYGIVLAGEEIFDIMQRDWMSDDRVAAVVRRTSYVHVAEESRHMAFARQKIRDRLRRMSRIRRGVSTAFIAVGTHVIAKSLVDGRIYADNGVDWQSVKVDVDGNEHHRMMFRRSAEHFIEFLERERLLSGSARWIYRKSNLL